MAHYLAVVETPLAAAEAFAYMADVTRFVDWDPSVRRAVRVAGEGAGLGTAYELTVEAGGTTVMRYEVKAYEPPRRILLVAHTAWLTSEDEISVEPAGSGSVVTYDAKLTLRGSLRLFDPLLGLAFRRLGDRASIGLRRVLKGTVVDR